MTDGADPQDVYEEIATAIEQVLIGNEPTVERLSIALFTGGHVLLEGVPGVAKTTVAELFARATGLDHSRIQLTPDTLPADITGTTVYREQTGAFEVNEGPVFANVVVADEINRATPKTQSALLEAMQEGQVTIDDAPRELPDPFLLVATQNPIEMEGTFELPEAQRDRFQFKLQVGLPDRTDERALLDRFDDTPGLGPDQIKQVVDEETIRAVREAVASVHVADPVKEYLLDLINETRSHGALDHGASPRAAIAYQNAIKGQAAIDGRTYTTPEDVRRLAQPILAHRLVLGTDAALSNRSPQSIVDDVLERVDPPSADGPGAYSPQAVGDGGTPE